MQRLNKNLAISAFGKIRNSLKTAVIGQMETFFELMSEDGLVNLGQIRDELYPQSEKASANASFNRFIKQINEELAAQGSRARLAITADKKVGDKRDCWFEAEPVQPPTPHTPQLDAIPEDQLEQRQLGLPMLDVDIVLITFNQHELEQTRRCFCPNAPAVQMEGHNRVYYQLGKHGGQNLVLIHSRQATIEAMKSAEIAIEVFHPNAVIALGIAFGINSEKQQIGEVLISESITTYELARINKDGSITPRGPRPPASKYLRDWFHQLDAYLNANNSAEYAKRYFGSMFSGDKLIDNVDYRDQLAKIDLEAIGGEMEGTGIYHACEASKTDWIVVKAICDFADGNKGNNKDTNQKIAAENAARLVKAALEFGNLYPTKKVSSSEKLRTKHSLKNFHDYTANCTTLHEIDERALVKDARALPTTLKKEQAALLEQEHTNGIPVVARLLDWAQEPQAKSVFAILGEYGMGKTISCQLFDKQLRSLLTQNKLLPVPLYFDLRHVTSKTLADGFQFSDLIKDCIRFGWLKNDASEEFTTSDIERWANQSGVVLIFDGLDEVLVKLSESDGRIFTDQLYKYQAELKANSKQPVKMLLTCRSQYFKTLDRQKDHFTGQERGGVKPDDIEAMVMLPLTEEQITNYLRHALPGIEPATIIDMVKSVHDLHDLSKRPFTLKLVGEFFPALEEDRKAGKAISGVGLYRRVVDRWLNRDDGKHQIKSDHKLQLASHLAALLWKQKQSALPASEIEDWFMGWLADNPKIAFRYQGISPDILEEDLRTATFLCREDDEQGSRFRFSHTSLQEFFLASYMLQAINDNKPDAWAIAKPSNETLVFLAQLLAEPEHKHLVNKLSEWRHQYHQHTSENLLHYALVAYGLGFSLPALDGIQLAGANLADLSIQAAGHKIISLEDANFAGANLRRATFSQVNLQGVNFNKASLDNAEFDQCHLSKSELVQANMAATRFFRCTLKSVNFSKANVYRSRLLQCESLPESVLKNSQWLINRPLLNDGNIYYATASHTSGVNTCVVTSDNRFLVSGSDDGILRQLDLASGECVREFFGHKSSISCCALTSDDRYLVSGSGDRILLLWNMESGEVLREFFGHQSWITSCALTSDDNYLVSGSDDGYLHLWDITSGECKKEFLGKQNNVSCCALTSDGRYLVSGSGNNQTLLLWDIDSGECLREFVGHQDWVTSCALTNDGRYLVSGSHDDSLRLWDIASGKCLREFLGHRNGVSSCTLTKDGRYLVSGSGDNSLRLWDVTRGDCKREFLGHQGWVTSCILTDEDNYLISTSADGSLRLWDLYSGECLREFVGNQDDINSCVLTSDDRYLISGSDDHSLRLWDFISGDCLREFVGHKSWITSCVLTSDDRYLISGSYDNSLRLWDFTSGECLREFVGHQRGVSSCVLTNDGRYLVSGSYDCTLRLWDLYSGECLREFVNGETGISSCVLTSDDRYLVSGSFDSSLRLWNLASGECVREFLGHESLVTCCALTRDNRFLASGSIDGKLRLWDLESGKCLQELLGHDNGVSSCVLTSDGRYLVSGSNDNSLRQWDLVSGDCIKELVAHTGSVTSVNLTSDDRFIVSGSQDSTVRLWSFETGEQLKITYAAPKGNYLSVTGDQQKILAKSEYAWRYFNGYFINEKGEPDSFPVI